MHRGCGLAHVVLGVNVHCLAGPPSGDLFNEFRGNQRVQCAEMIEHRAARLLVQPADGGATEVTSVDFSTPATQATLRNIQHNQHRANIRSATFETLDQDAFEALAQMKSVGKKFDIVILDPPMFAQNQSQIETALNAYRRLTLLGLGVLKRGGILVQASCSSRVSADDFFNTIHKAAQEAGRPLKEIERTGHALDHPTSYKEGAYLKCLFAVAP